MAAACENHTCFAPWDLARRKERVVLGIALGGCLLRLFFWFYTGRVWEDALITVLHSENCARGLGLTHYHPGMPPVHGFTSPLGVLIPLAADLVHVGWGLPFLQLVSAFLSIPTVVLAGAIASHPAFRLNRWLVYLLCGYLAFAHYQILWSMAGMETQVAVLALFLAMHLALQQRYRPLGAAMAFCLYARPDFAIFLVFVGLYIAVTDRKALLSAAAITAALYAPWILFTTLYYGSPVPNTIAAKGLGYRLWLLDVPLFSRACFNTAWARLWHYIFLPLGPCYAGHGMGIQQFMDEGLIAHLALLSMAAGAWAMAARFHRFYVIPWGGVAAFSVYYIFLVQNIFAWYLVPFAALGCLWLVLGLGALADTLVRPSRIDQVCRAACFVFMAPLLITFPVSMRADRDIQREIEPLRREIGQYLFSHKRPGDRVGCEPLGNIAYYSQMPVLDYPGLASAEVVAFLKRAPVEQRSMDRMLEHFRPEWIVLREHEYRDYIARDYMKVLGTQYTKERVFRADPSRSAAILRVESNGDCVFLLLHKLT